MLTQEEERVVRWLKKNIECNQGLLELLRQGLITAKMDDDLREPVFSANERTPC
jgi:hypothetical protein